jgi:hypothetical protein
MINNFKPVKYKSISVKYKGVTYPDYSATFKITSAKNFDYEVGYLKG